MNNFFEKAIALRNRYYDNAVKLNSQLVSLLNSSATDPCDVCEMEVLSQLIAVYFKYGEYFPDEFYIRLPRVYNGNYLSNTIDRIFSDLSINYKVNSLFCCSFPKMCKSSLSAYTYYITLSKQIL